MRHVYLSAALVASMSMAAYPAQAEPDLGQVVGAIAQTVLQQQQAEHERALWAGVIKNGSAAAYRQYLETYPRGPNAQAARNQLARLEGNTATRSPAQIEAGLGLTRADRMAVQRRLATLGYYRSGIDGVFGSGTRRAIASWQSANKLPGGGYLNAAQAQRLRGAATATPAAPAAGTGNATAAARAELGLGLTRWQRVQIQRDLTALGYDPKGVDGLFGNGTRAAIRAWQRNTGQAATGYMTAAQVKALRADAQTRGTEAARGSGAALDEDLLGLTRSERIQVQQRLINLGYLAGRADGIFGSGTRQAISRWQGDNGVGTTGYLTGEQVRTLRAQSRL